MAIGVGAVLAIFTRLFAGDLAAGTKTRGFAPNDFPKTNGTIAAERATGLFALNAAPARAVPPAVRDRADLVIVNRLEASALGAVRGDALVAVTFGADGAELRRGDGTVLARATPPPVVAVDGTGAGDSFCGALVVGLLEGRDHDVALRRACAAGALAASRPGAQPSLPTAAEVDEILTR